MRKGTWLPLALLLPALAVAAARADEKQKPAAGATAAKVGWKKLTIDRKFRAEGVGVADINKDGKTDITIGDVWFEAPDWKMHVIRADRSYDPKVYSVVFGCFAEDFNGDGWQDVLIIPFPGHPCTWCENPGAKGGPWKEHVLWHSACNETPIYVDLHGTGKRVLVMGWQPLSKIVRGKDGYNLDTTGNQGQMAWFRPGKDPTALWEMHPISGPSTPGKEIPGTQRFSHGLGAGDLNGDGKPDVICTAGWWEQPAKDTGKPWKFHAADLSPVCADMHGYDIDGDGKADVLSSSAHSYGIWWHQQQKEAKNGSLAFVRRDLFPKIFSQSHALVCTDIDGDGVKDFVTGRRWWAHGPKGDPGSQDPAVLFWFRGKKARDGSVTFEPNQIDDDSGIGTQFTVADLDGDGVPDIIVSNKKGTHAFLQVRAGRVEGAPGRKE